MYNYEDSDLEDMSKEQLLKVAKHLRDRTRESYEFLIRKPGYPGSKIHSTQSGQLVSFSEFVEKSNFGALISEYVKKAISEYTSGGKK
jgi:hypothetical protein